MRANIQLTWLLPHCPKVGRNQKRSSQGTCQSNIRKLLLICGWKIYRKKTLGNSKRIRYLIIRLSGRGERLRKLCSAAPLDRTKSPHSSSTVGLHKATPVHETKVLRVYIFCTWTVRVLHGTTSLFHEYGQGLIHNSKIRLCLLMGISAVNNAWGQSAAECPSKLFIADFLYAVKRRNIRTNDNVGLGLDSPDIFL